MERNVKAITYVILSRTQSIPFRNSLDMVQYSPNSLFVHTIKGDISLETRSNKRENVDYATERACGIVSLAELAVVKS